MSVACPRCQLLLELSAGQQGSCPRCGQVIAVPVDEPPIVRTTAYRPKKRNDDSGWIVLTVATVLGASFVALGVYCSGITNGNSPTTVSRYGEAGDWDTRYDAKMYAREAVRMSLKWPDDADFLEGEEVVAIRGKPHYFQVNGKVKAANGFGAKLTHPFTVDVRIHDLAAKEWRYHLVILNGQVAFNQPWTPPAKKVVVRQ